MWIALFFTVANAFSAPVVAELYFPKHKVSAQLSWATEPSESQSAVLHLRFSEAISAKVQAELVMPEMDHRAVPGIPKQLGPQEFQVQRLLFFMRGDWDVRVRLSSFWIGSEEAVWPVTIGPGGICSPR